MTWAWTSRTRSSRRGPLGTPRFRRWRTVLLRREKRFLRLGREQRSLRRRVQLRRGREQRSLRRRVQLRRGREQRSLRRRVQLRREKQPRRQEDLCGRLRRGSARDGGVILLLRWVHR